MSPLEKEFIERKSLFLKKNNIYSLIFVLLIFFLDRYSKIEILNNFSNNAFFVILVIYVIIVMRSNFAF